MDSRIVNYYFIEYSERSRGFKFYDPLSISFSESGNAKFIEDVEYSRSVKLMNIVFEEEYVPIPSTTTVIAHVIMQDANMDNQDSLEISHTHIEEPTPTHVNGQQQPQLEVSLRRST